MITNLPKNKYYIPTLEDLFSGCVVENYEFCIDELGDPALNYERWVKKPLTSSHLRTMLEYGIKHTRIPYLTKEDIRDEGWIVKTPDSNLIRDNVFFFEKDNYFLISDFNLQIPFLTFFLRDPSLMLDKMPDAERWRVCVNVRCINDFRKVVKML